MPSLKVDPEKAKELSAGAFSGPKNPLAMIGQGFSDVMGAYKQASSPPPKNSGAKAHNQVTNIKKGPR